MFSSLSKFFGLGPRASEPLTKITVDVTPEAELAYNLTPINTTPSWSNNESTPKLPPISTIYPGTSPLPATGAVPIKPISTSTQTYVSGKGNTAFNLNQGLKLLLKIPGDFALGWSRWLGNFASGKFKDNFLHLYDKDLSPGKQSVNLLVQDPSLRDPESSEAVRQVLNEQVNEIGMINNVNKMIMYGAGILGNILSVMPIMQESDPIHRRNLAIKNICDFSENSGMFIEKGFRFITLYSVFAHDYSLAALSIFAGLHFSNLAWISAFIGGRRMIQDEKHLNSLKTEEGKLANPIQNSANYQNAIGKITNAIVRVPLQALIMGGAGMMYLHQQSPEIADWIYDTVPLVESYMTASLADGRPINSEQAYYWISGSYYLPIGLAGLFALVSVIGPGFVLKQSAQNFVRHVKNYTVLKREKTETSSESANHAFDNSVLSGLSILSSTLLVASAIAMSYPPSDPHSYILGVGSGLFLTAQYLYKDRKVLQETAKNWRRGYEIWKTITDGDVNKPAPTALELYEPRPIT